MEEIQNGICKTEDGITVQQITLAMETEQNRHKKVPTVSMWACGVILAVVMLVLVVAVLMFISLADASAAIRYYA